MTVRAAITTMATRARLTAIGCGAVTVLACAVVSACTGGGHPTAGPSIATPDVTSAVHTGGSPSPTGLFSGTARVPSSSASPSPSASHSASASPTHSPSPSASPSPSPTATQTTFSPAPVVPSGAPITGGGGTAGLQDAALFGAGGAAILAGAGSMAYRRRLTRSRRRR